MLLFFFPGFFTDTYLCMSMVFPYLSDWALSTSLFGTGRSSSIHFRFFRPIISADGAAAALVPATGPKPRWSCGIQRCEDVVERVDHNYLRWGCHTGVMLQRITKKSALSRLFVLLLHSSFCCLLITVLLKSYCLDRLRTTWFLLPVVTLWLCQLLCLA